MVLVAALRSRPSLLPPAVVPSSTISGLKYVWVRNPASVVPSIVTGAVMTGSRLKGCIVNELLTELKFGSVIGMLKTILVCDWTSAVLIASRREPAPVSAVVFTM